MTNIIKSHNKKKSLKNHGKSQEITENRTK